jgi:hypothetical protein
MAPQRAHSPAAAVNVPVEPHLPQRDSQCRARRVPLARGLRAEMPFSPGASVPSTDHPMAPACARRRSTSSSGFISWRKRSRSAASLRGCRAGTASRVAAVLALDGFTFSPYCCARLAGTRVRRTLVWVVLVMLVAGLTVVSTASAVELRAGDGVAIFAFLRGFPVVASLFDGDLRAAFLSASRVIVTSPLARDFALLTVLLAELSFAFCGFPALAAGRTVEERFAGVGFTGTVFVLVPDLTSGETTVPAVLTGRLLAERLPAGASALGASFWGLAFAFVPAFATTGRTTAGTGDGAGTDSRAFFGSGVATGRDAGTVLVLSFDAFFEVRADANTGGDLGAVFVAREAGIGVLIPSEMLSLI